MYDGNKLPGPPPNRILPAMQVPSRILPAVPTPLKRFSPNDPQKFIDARIQRRQAAQLQNSIDLSILERFNAKYGIPENPPIHNFENLRSEFNESAAVAEVPISAKEKSRSKSPEKVPACPISFRTERPKTKFGVTASWPQPVPQPHMLPPSTHLAGVPLEDRMTKDQVLKVPFMSQNQTTDKTRLSSKGSSYEHIKRGRSRPHSGNPSLRRRRSISSSSSDRSRSPDRRKRGGRSKIDFSYLYSVSGASTSHKLSDQDWMNETENFLKSIQTKPTEPFSQIRKTREDLPELVCMDGTETPMKKKTMPSEAPNPYSEMVHIKLLALVHAMKMESDRGGRVDRQLVDRLYDELELNRHEKEGNKFIKTMMSEQQFMFPERSLEPIVKPNPCQFIKNEDIFQDDATWTMVYPGREETPQETNNRLASVISKIKKLTDDRTPLPLQHFKELWKDE